MSLNYNEQAKTVTMSVDYFFTHFNVKPVELAQGQIKHTEEKPLAKVQNLDATISNLLKQLGVTPANRGFRYLREAVAIAVDRPEAVEKFTKVIYPEVANLSRTTPSRVERAIRHAIETSWDKNEELQENIFSNTTDLDKTKATNRQFISGIADYIRLGGVKNGI